MIGLVLGDACETVEGFGHVEARLSIVRIGLRQRLGDGEGALEVGPGGVEIAGVYLEVTKPL